MILEEDVKLDFLDVLIRPKRSTLSSRKEVELFREFNFKYSKKKHRGIPIIASNMDGVGTFEMARVLEKNGLLICLTKTYTEEELIQFFTSFPNPDAVAYSIGIADEDLEKFSAVYRQCASKIKFLCIDVANGYTERFSNFVGKMRDMFPDLVIIAGNVASGDMTTELLLRGADIVKCGIGPGSMCTTREKTGVGYPQLSAIIECADAAHGVGGHIVADGGCTSPGDVAKAFGAGADFVMLGGMFAGHDEGGGEYIREEGTGKLVGVRFYGMSSDCANKKHFGGLKDYRAAEGRELVVPYRGKIQGTVQEILGGLRSTCTYVGSQTLKSLPKCATFIKVSRTHNTIFEKNSVEE